MVGRRVECTEGYLTPEGPGGGIQLDVKNKFLVLFFSKLLGFRTVIERHTFVAPFWILGKGS